MTSNALTTFDVAAPFFQNVAAARRYALMLLERGVDTDNATYNPWDLVSTFAGEHTHEGDDDHIALEDHSTDVMAALAIGVALGMMLRPSVLPSKGGE